MKTFIICALDLSYQHDQNKERRDQQGMYQAWQIGRLQSGNLKEGDNLENIDIDERIGCGLDSGDTGQGTVAGF